MVNAIIPPWRLNLQPASFNGAGFHVEVETRAGGRRIAMKEFPKRDTPYAEDMGRRARQFAVVGYVIGPDFEFERDLLMEQLDLEVNGSLILPTSQDSKIVVCDTYKITERRERGGYAEIEMVFMEAGSDPSISNTSDTPTTVRMTANSVSGSPTFQDTTNTFINSSDITRLA